MATRPQLSRFRLHRTAWTDILVVGTIIVVLNVVFVPQDIGWLRLHPSPYFLLPILIGCRYGFSGGMFAALAATIVGLIGLGQHGNLSAGLQQNGYFFGSLFFIGGVCGEVLHTLQKKEVEVMSLYGNAQERLKKLDEDMFLLREAKAELERLLATRDSELSTLDSDLRRLFDSEDDELQQNILLLLNRQARISEAAIYLQQEEPNRFTRTALIGKDLFLPLEIEGNQIEMVAMAIKHKTTVTIPEFWQKTVGQHRNYLVAVPLLDSDEKLLGVLVITSMPFIALNKKAVQLISLICRWASRVLEIRGKSSHAYRIVNGLESQKIFHTEFFRQNVELAHASFMQHNLPSSVVLFAAAEPSTMDQEAFEKVMMQLLRGGDCPATLGLAMPHLAVLLPLTGERGANIFMDRIRLNFPKLAPPGSVLDARVFAFQPRQTMALLWSDLTTYAAQNPGLVKL